MSNKIRKTAILDSDSDDDVNINTNHNYAKNFDTWKNKGELRELSGKYEEGANFDSDSSSSEDDDTGIELTEEVEKEFYKTLALLKSKDPTIYDDNVVFFDKSKNGDQKPRKKSDEKSMSINDYNRKLLLEKGGIVSDSDEDFEEIRDLTNTEEQRKTKESFQMVEPEESSDDKKWGGLFDMSQVNGEVQKKEESCRSWLVGKIDKLEDEKTAKVLQPLKDLWADENLDDGDKFIKDYFINQRYMENENEGTVPKYDEIVDDPEDENALEQQEEFEHKYNFRFEEPDQEFIKRYPRTISNSLRKEDNRRKLKRIETKERKAKEKAEKMEELSRLRDLKRKEIEEKIEKLKEVAGIDEIGFKDEDIDGDFDAEDYDKRMQALFNDEYYERPGEEQKPKLDLDDVDGLELEIENFDNWTGNDDGEENAYEPHCEDEDFIMDADYDARAATQKELIENSKKKKKRRRKSKFVEMLTKDRPSFDPTDKSCEEYIEEYYKLECEDIIDNIPCRFKYRKVPPNNFGLTVEEILFAKDRELNKWCSLKKAVQFRPDHVEKYEQIAYSKKGENIHLKKKVLPSLFVDETEETFEAENSKEQNLNKNSKYSTVNKQEESVDRVKTEDSITEDLEGTSIKMDDVVENSIKKKKKKKNTSVNIEGSIDKAKTEDSITEDVEGTSTKMEDVVENSIKKKKKKKNTSLNIEGSVDKSKTEDSITEDVEGTTTKIEDVVENSIKKQKKRKNSSLTDGKEINTVDITNTNLNPLSTSKLTNTEGSEVPNTNKLKKKRKNKKKGPNTPDTKPANRKRKHPDSMNDKVSSKKIKKNKPKNAPEIGLSDARIAAYGLNPKKFKNKMVYGNKSKNK